MIPAPNAHPAAALPAWWRAALIWAAGWAALFALESRIDLAHEALLLVLISALAAVWSPRWLAVLAPSAAVLSFNYFFVPPRGSFFMLSPERDAPMLAATLVVSAIVSVLMSRQRELAAAARELARDAGQLRELGEALREVDDPRTLGPRLQRELGALLGRPAALLLCPPARGRAGDAPGTDDAGALWLGEIQEDQRTHLWQTVQRNRAMGRGSGEYESLDGSYLPLRGRERSYGAALLPRPPGSALGEPALRHAQALCDQMGLAMERSDALAAAAASRELAQTQEMRSTLLAAVSHDHRTPLAIILGAASSLHDQADRLSAEQRRNLSATIVDEATQLARLTENTLQLARLDAAGLKLRKDWESAEEIVGTVMRRMRQRDPQGRVTAHVESGLPLLHCDAVLLVQMLENLVDNALKYSGDDGPIEIVARMREGRVGLSVEDRGPGVPKAERERIFMAFQRGETRAQPLAPDAPTQRGAGVGLAVCKAIARVHGGELLLHERSGGGASFEFLLPVVVSPATSEDTPLGTVVS